MKSKFFFLVLWLCLMAGSGFAQLGKLTKVPINTRNANIKGYVEYLPPNYVADGSKKYPILYWLHGLGETGAGSSSSLETLMNRQIGNWLKTHDTDFIILIPQDASGYWNGATNGIQKFVEWANVYYANAIDVNQQHMAGLSAGGYGIRDFIIGNSAAYKAFATFTPMSTNLNAAVSKVQQIVDNNQFVWIHQGTADNDPNAIYSVTSFHNALYKIDNTRSRITAYSGLGHSAWEKVYNGNGRTTTKLTGTQNGTTYYNWTTSDPDVDWYGWMKAHPKQGTAPVVVAPTAITLSNTTIPGASAPGAVVGTLTANGTAPTLSLATGSYDNANFIIESNSLKVLSPLNFISKATYTVQVTAQNSAGSYNRTFAITSSDVVPSTIALSNAAIPADNANGTVVGALTANGTQPVTVQLVSGSLDNASFTIESNSLKVAAHLDFASRASYSVEVEAKNYTGLVRKTFTIVSSDVAPSAIVLSNTAIPGNNTAGTTVGNLSAAGSQPLAFQLVSGSMDNANFTVESNVLKVSTPLNFYNKASYAVEVEATNALGTARATFTITTSDVKPTTIALSNTAIPSSNVAGTTVGTLSANGTQPVLTLVAGSSDNAFFYIENNVLKVASPLNFSSKASYTAEVEAKNSAGSFKKAFAVVSSNAVSVPYTMYPVPLTGNTLYVSISSADVFFNNITVINKANGYILKRFINVSTPLGTPLALDFSDIPAGSYTLQIWRRYAPMETLSIIKN